VSCPAMRGENPLARVTDGLDARPQVSQEDHLGDDRREASTLGFEDAEGRAIDRFGLPARLRGGSGRLAVKEKLPGLGTFDPTQDDRAAMCFDRLGNGLGRHCDLLTGDGSWLHARTMPAVSSACREPVAARRLATSGGLDQTLVA